MHKRCCDLLFEPSRVFWEEMKPSEKMKTIIFGLMLFIQYFDEIWTALATVQLPFIQFSDFKNIIFNILTFEIMISDPFAKQLLAIWYYSMENVILVDIPPEYLTCFIENVTFDSNDSNSKRVGLFPLISFEHFPLHLFCHLEIIWFS